ncbi:MAG: (Fe-S)-binding protein [Christensenellales bacterium]
MVDHFADFYAQTKEKLLSSCTRCGNCISKCKARGFLPYSKPAAGVQAEILDFFSTGILSENAALKVDGCMRCFGCLDIQCPIGVDSLTINDLIAIERAKEKEPSDGDAFAYQRGLAISNATPEEYARITAPRIKEGSRIVFFPGCNIYKQPDKLLNALDILNAVTDDYSFLPGFDYCCGTAFRTAGNPGAEQAAGARLADMVARIQPEALVFWCPTCICQAESRMKPLLNMKMNYMTFGQYVLAHINQLDFSHAKPRKVTLHEPCKSSYMKLDVNSVRNILKSIPKTELIEMEHYGENTLCCGCATAENAPETCDRMTLARLSEARATGADTLIDVCHNCHWLMKPCQQRHSGFNFRIQNYSTYILEALGKTRKDTLI